jgi:hypothetical protein
LFSLVTPTTNENAHMDNVLCSRLGPYPVAVARR